MEILTDTAGVVIGGLITWWVTQRYYKEAAKDLGKEAKELRRLINYMLLGMESMGWIKLNRDEHGTPCGYNYILKAESGSYTIEGSSADLVKTSRNKED